MADDSSIQALDQLEAELSAANAEAVDPQELCRIYQQVKGPLEVILPWIERLVPNGKLIVQAIRLLMKIADGLCPA